MHGCFAQNRLHLGIGPGVVLGRVAGEAAFEAARWAIDAVKASAPIWKLEHHDEGTTWGQCHHEPAPAEAVVR